MAFIEVDQVTKIYTPKGVDPVYALDGLDLSVPQGTIIALLGPNGAGKTTTVKVLTTLIKPDSGTAVIDGIDVLRYPERIRPLIGVSGQYAAVDENLTGFENLDMVGRLYHLGVKASRQRAKELIEIFELTEAMNRPVKGFSGGMRRRIDLAGALVTRPKVLFLDEPTTGLDPHGRLGMWDIITNLVGEGTTVLLTTQYLEEADRLADSISVIDEGKVIARGTADELKASSGGQRVEINLVTADDRGEALQVLTRYGSAQPTVSSGGRWLTVGANDGPAALQGILGELSSRNIRLYDAGMRRPTLDEVFLRLTGHAASVKVPAGTPAGTPAEPAGESSGEHVAVPGNGAGRGRHRTDQHGTDQHGTDQHGTDQHGTDQHGTDQHGLEEHGPEVPVLDGRRAQAPRAERHPSDRERGGSA